MIDNLDDAINNANLLAKGMRAMAAIGLDSMTDTIRVEKCKECAAEYEQLAEMLTELKQLRERVKSLEHSAEYYRDSLFGDGIVFSLKIMRGE